MVLWNFDLLWKTMVLRKKKLWYYTESYGTSIYVGKNIVDYQKLRNFDIQWKNYGNIPKQLKFLKILHF